MKTELEDYCRKAQTDQVTQHPYYLELVDLLIEKIEAEQTPRKRPLSVTFHLDLFKALDRSLDNYARNTENWKEPYYEIKRQLHMTEVRAKAGQRNKALKNLDSAVKTFEANRNLLYSDTYLCDLSQKLARLEKFEDAEIAIKKNKHWFDISLSYKTLAAEMAKAGRVEEALKKVRKIRHPDEKIYALAEIGACAAEQGDTNKAKKTFDNALRFALKYREDYTERFGLVNVWDKQIRHMLIGDAESTAAEIIAEIKGHNSSSYTNFNQELWLRFQKAYPEYFKEYWRGTENHRALTEAGFLAEAEEIVKDNRFCQAETAMLEIAKQYIRQGHPEEAIKRISAISHNACFKLLPHLPEEHAKTFLKSLEGKVIDELRNNTNESNASAHLENLFMLAKAQLDFGMKDDAFKTARIFYEAGNDLIRYTDKCELLKRIPYLEARLGSFDQAKKGFSGVLKYLEEDEHNTDLAVVSEDDYAEVALMQHEVGFVQDARETCKQYLNRQIALSIENAEKLCDLGLRLGMHDIALRAAESSFYHYYNLRMDIKDSRNWEKVMNLYRKIIFHELDTENERHAAKAIDSLIEKADIVSKDLLRSNRYSSYDQYHNRKVSEFLCDIIEKYKLEGKFDDLEYEFKGFSRPTFNQKLGYVLQCGLCAAGIAGVACSSDDPVLVSINVGAGLFGAWNYIWPDSDFKTSKLNNALGYAYKKTRRWDKALAYAYAGLFSAVTQPALWHIINDQNILFLLGTGVVYVLSPILIGSLSAAAVDKIRKKQNAKKT